jgi:hypothetical protein
MFFFAFVIAYEALYLKIIFVGRYKTPPFRAARRPLRETVAPCPAPRVSLGGGIRLGLDAARGPSPAPPLAPARFRASLGPPGSVQP